MCGVQRERGKGAWRPRKVQELVYTSLQFPVATSGSSSSIRESAKLSRVPLRHAVTAGPTPTREPWKKKRPTPSPAAAPLAAPTPSRSPRAAPSPRTRSSSSRASARRPPRPPRPLRPRPRPVPSPGSALKCQPARARSPLGARWTADR